MAEVRDDVRYLATHEWVKLEADGSVVVGISDHAQDALGDVVFVELPEIGTSFVQGSEMAVVESVKAASDIYAPVSGVVVACNSALEDAPETVNDSPYDAGWFVRLTPDEPSSIESLLSPDAYQALCDDETH